VSTFHGDTGSGVWNLTTFTNAVHTFFSNSVSLTSNNITWTGDSIATTIDPATGQPSSVSPVTPWTVVGTQVSDEMSPATQGLLEWHTGTYAGGREIRGKTFMCGTVVSHNTAPGVPTSTYLSGLQANATALITNAGSLCVYSRKNHTAALITSGTPWSKWAVLRGRRDG
jgi:hypothetical protein